MKNNNDLEIEVPKYALESFARRILPEIQRFFESEEGKQEFEAWKAEQEENNYIENERN